MMTQQQVEVEIFDVTGKLIGAVMVVEVVIDGLKGCEPDQLAASAWAKLANYAIYKVRGEAFTAQECKEWYA